MTPETEATAWIGGALAAINCIITFGKTRAGLRFFTRLGPWRPWVAWCLGLAAGALALVQGGQPWPVAVATALTGGASAMTHDAMRARRKRQRKATKKIA